MPIFKHSVSLLIDTGSTLTIAKQSSLINNLNINVNEITSITGLNHIPILTIGTVSSIFQTRSTSFSFYFHIIKDVEISLPENIDGILGTDFLQNCNLDLNKNKLVTYNNRLFFDLYQIKNHYSNKIDSNYKESDENKEIREPKLRYESLIANVSLTHLELTVQIKIQNLIKKYYNVFYLKNDSISHCNTMKHKIHLKNNYNLSKCFIKQFPINPALELIMKKEIEKLIKLDVVEECLHSEFNSPIFLLKKPDNSYRFITDMRNLNQSHRT